MSPYVLIARKKHYLDHQLEGLVVVNLGHTIVSEDELLDWYSEKYAIERMNEDGHLTMIRLPRMIDYTGGLTP